MKPFSWFLLRFSFRRCSKSPIEEGMDPLILLFEMSRVSKLPIRDSSIGRGPLMLLEERFLQKVKCQTEVL
uniref:Uncharacterized protein n=1 Tax=Rhizophora mucronata TaxID=61149 RepID=A0A2P2MQV3_RHIMU